MDPSSCRFGATFTSVLAGTTQPSCIDSSQDVERTRQLQGRVVYGGGKLSEKTLDNHEQFYDKLNLLIGEY